MSIQSTTAFKRHIDDITTFDADAVRPQKRVKYGDSTLNQPRVFQIESPFAALSINDKSSEVAMNNRILVPISTLPSTSQCNFSAVTDSNSFSELPTFDFAAEILMTISLAKSAFKGPKRIIPSTAPLHAMPILITPSSPHEFNPLLVNTDLPETNKSPMKKLQPSIQSQSHSVDAIFEQAKKYMDNAEYALAIEYFSRVVKSHPKFDEVQYHTGLCYEIQKEYENAKRHYLRVSQCSSFIDKAEFRIGLCLFKQGNHARAKEHFRNVKESSHIDFGYAQFYHGQCGFDTLQYISAIKHFIKVPKTHHLYGEAQYKIGKCYVELDNLLEASEHYNNVPRYHPEFVDAHFGIGVLLFKKENFAKAEEHFDKVPSSNQQYFKAQNYMASIRWITRPKSTFNASQSIGINGD